MTVLDARGNGSRHDVSDVDVLFVPDTFRGGYLLRSRWPADVLRSRGITTAVTVGDLGRWEFARPKVVVVHRSLDPRKYIVAAHFRRQGSRVVISEDDAIWWLPPGHPAKLLPQVEDVKEATRRSVIEADGVIVTSDALAEFHGRWNSRLDVIENYLPAWIGSHARPPELGPVWDAAHSPGEPIVGYRGAVGVHGHDLDWITPVAPAMLRGTRFLAIGDTAEAYAERLGVTPWRAHPWVKERELYRLMASCDLGIVPLLPHRFNDAKSWLAALEWATLGVPVVATATRENVKLSDVLGTDVHADALDGFVSDVRAHVENPGVRDLFARRLKRNADTITLEAMVPETWEKVLRGYM